MLFQIICNYNIKSVPFILLNKLLLLTAVIKANAEICILRQYTEIIIAAVPQGKGHHIPVQAYG